MVEGPGATRNARKMQAAVGCVVVAPPLDEHHDQHQQAPSAQQHQWIMGTSLVEAFCVGKEVFLVFSNDTALRLHFGMNGSLTLSQDGKPVSQRYYKKQQPASIQINFKSSEDDARCFFVMECHQTTVGRLSAFVARSKRERLQALDACAPENTFDPTCVLQALRKRPTAMICDAVLDQNKFPGVGNIIKMEGLHSAKVHPKRLVSSLSDSELCSTILKCRQYAMGWLKCGRAPTKKVYNQTTCKTCQTHVRMAKLGNDLSRVTFWCENCQPLAPSPLSLSSEKQQRPPLSTIRPQQPTALTKSPQSKPQTACCCPQHGIKSVCIRRVRNKEQNKHRLFATCKRQGCPYFVWMDAHFPNCAKCQRKTILRVSKKEHSGGRWFLACASSCSGTFAWATPQQLSPLGTFLTPLL